MNCYLTKFNSFDILKVISNDELYGHDSKYIDEINSLCTQVCSQILLSLKVLADNNNLRQQANFALELFSRICQNSEVTEDKAFQLANNLFNLAAKQKAIVDSKVFVSFFGESYFAGTGFLNFILDCFFPLSIL